MGRREGVVEAEEEGFGEIERWGLHLCIKTLV